MDSEGEFTTVARETFEYSVVPWAGRKYESWIRSWARPNQRDPHGLVQLPTMIMDAYKERTPGQRLSSREAQAMGYPRVPGEQELVRVRRELHEALGRCDWERAHDLDAELRELQTRVADMRISALRPRAAVGR